MKGKLCFGLLLLLSIIVGSLSNASSTFSLAHDYNGILLMSQNIPEHYITVDGRTSIDWDYNYSRTSDFNPSHSFYLFVRGNAYDESYQDLQLKNTLAFMSLSYNPSISQCQYYSNYSTPILDIIKSSSSLSISANSTFYYGYNFFDSRLSNFQFDQTSPYYSYCQHREPFGSSPQPSFDFNSLPSGYLTCGLSSGTACQGVQDFRSFANTQFLPNYWFSTDGFYVHSHAIDTDSGIHYNHAFSFNDLFTTNITKFSRLDIPLMTTDGYFTNSSNFYSGRHLEWRGVFEFDGSFEWNPNLPSNSYFQIRFNSSNGPTPVANCTTNLRTVPDLGVTHLEYSCPLDLSTDYAWLDPYLSISGGSINDVPQYVWETDDNWYFGHQLLITDFDETEGQSFNSELHGNTIPGDAVIDMNNDHNADWFSSLVNLFNFNILNPFAPLFSLFTNSSQCVNIPTIAGMLHSNETTYCSWFPSSVRTVLTPVLGLASVMLLFGFIVRWLGSSSGNFFEDSKSETVSWSGRAKKGKK